MGWPGFSRTRPALVASHRGLAGTFEFDAEYRRPEAGELLSRERALSVLHAIGDDLERLAVFAYSRSGRQWPQQVPAQQEPHDMTTLQAHAVT